MNLFAVMKVFFHNFEQHYKAKVIEHDESQTFLQISKEILDEIFCNFGMDKHI